MIAVIEFSIRSLYIYILSYLNQLSKMFARTMLKAPMMKARTFATGTGAKTFKEKSFKEAWLSDAGAYPVMTVIGKFLFVSLYIRPSP